MAGNTAAIDVAHFRAAWEAHVPIRLLCDNFSITRDQVTRLKFIWHLPPRHDRRFRFKPAREIPPDPEEEAASQASLNLAPQIAARVTCVQITWDERTRLDRQVLKPQPFSIRVLDVPEEASWLVDDPGGTP